MRTFSVTFASRTMTAFIVSGVLAGCASSGGSPVAPAGQTQLGAAARSVFTAVRPESIVYTPVNETITNDGTLKLDLNNDGVSDFSFRQSYSPIYMHVVMGPPRLCGAIGGVSVKQRRGNGVANGAQVGWAAALASGSQIDSSLSFDLKTSLMYGYAVGCMPPHRVPYSDGYWNNRHAYLGLEFKIQGQTHYGWAQMSVSGGEYGITTTLTGYAYETVAGMSIAAGQTK
jgi:hypothetical protein